MSLIERFRTAEHQGREAARQQFSRARLSLEEAQSRLRRKMRIYPRQLFKAPLSGVAGKGTSNCAAPGAGASLRGKDAPPQAAETHEKQVA